jgi:hypothetical protein
MVLHMEGVVVSDEDSVKTEAELVGVDDEEIVAIVPVPVKERVEVRVYREPVTTGEVEDEKVGSEAVTDGEGGLDCVEDNEGVTNEVGVTITVFD